MLRIEDLDRARSKSEYASQVMRDFELLGLTWVGQPLHQSDRDQIYADVFDKLEARGLTYPCFCTRADLHAASAPHRGEKPIYAGTCRRMAAHERAAKEAQAQAQGRHPAQRLVVPDRIFGLADVFQGEYYQDLARDCGDFVIRRSDLSYAYQLAVVIDDAEQGVNCVVRGCDLLSSTPQQLFLHEALDLRQPSYAHVPLMMGADGRRLSKRHADANLECLLHALGTPEGVLGHIAFSAAMIPEDEPVSAEELVELADLRPLCAQREILWR